MCGECAEILLRASVLPLLLLPWYMFLRCLLFTVLFCLQTFALCPFKYVKTSHTNTAHVHACLVVLSVLPPSFHPLYVNLRIEDGTLRMAFKLTPKPQSQCYIYLTDARWALDDTDSPAVLAWGPGWGVRATLDKRIMQKGKHLSGLVAQNTGRWVDTERHSGQCEAAGNIYTFWIPAQNWQVLYQYSTQWYCA